MSTSTDAPVTVNPWPWWRKLLCVVGVIVLGASIWARPTRFPEVEWAVGAAVAGASVSASFCLIVGFPRRTGAPTDHPRILLRIARVFAHPMVAAPINCLVLIGVFWSGLVDRAAGSSWAWAALMLFLLVMGLFADAGVMLPGLLPRVGPGLQVFFATICGIIDQLPGVGVMALHRHAAGVAMWLIAQPTIFPVLIVLLVEWFRADQAKAREEDARLDAVEASGGFVGLP